VLRLLRLISSMSGGSNIHAAALTMSGTGLLLALNIATGIIAARTLGPAGRGEMMALGLWSPFLATVTTFGLPSAVNYVIRNTPCAPREIFGTAAGLAITIGTAAALVATAILPLVLADRYEAAQIWFAQQCVMTLPLVLLFIVAIACFQADARFHTYNVWRVLPTLLTLIGLIALSAADLVTPERAILAYLLPMVVAGPIASLIAVRGRPVVTWQTVLQLMAYGLRAYGAEIVGGVGASVDRLLVVAFLPPTDVGIFFVARNLADAVMGLPASLSAVLLPRAAAASKRDAVRLAGLTARFGFMGTALVALVVGASASWLIPHLYGPGFEPAAPVSWLLLAEVVLTGTAVTLGQAYLAAGRPGLFSNIQLASSGIAAGLLAIALPRGGLHAAAVVLVIVSALRLAMVWLGFRSALRERLPRLLLYPRDVQALLPPSTRHGLTRP
jgi:enterobacterial common antigen flippase